MPQSLPERRVAPRAAALLPAGRRRAGPGSPARASRQVTPGGGWGDKPAEVNEDVADIIAG
ncbi:hypothetical protein [Muricoccus pecuniae]|uniref:Uncharacterized protein n=1 Tax=Muricoccus pecuniae TaxID=693023 RepID=A0A840YBD1_9PROT|nr:hypothetical protein [Roseomonas pecuniae]MBB5693361.1 hypothetical protein [Roseomonas pecuniae]